MKNILKDKIDLLSRSFISAGEDYIVNDLKSQFEEIKKLILENESPTPLSEDKINELAEKRYPTTYEDDQVRTDDRSYKIKRDAYSEGIKLGFSLTKNSEILKENRNVLEEEI